MTISWIHLGSGITTLRPRSQLLFTEKLCQCSGPLTPRLILILLHRNIYCENTLNKFMFQCFFQYLNFKIPLICTLTNEYPSSNEIGKLSGSVRGDCIACDALFTS